jgi:hypothetical protein
LALRLSQRAKPLAAKQAFAQAANAIHVPISPQMDTLLATLCDSATDYHGHLCTLGSFDTISSMTFPCQHHHCSIALRFVFRPEDAGTHHVHAILIDSDGKSILQDGGPRMDIDIGPIPEETFFLSRNVVFSINGLPIPRPGLYSFDIHYDGEMITRIPLQAVLIR